MSRPSRRMSLAKLFTGSGGAKSEQDGAADATRPDEGGDENKACAIRVVVRARPLNDRELLAKTPVVVNVKRTSIQVVNPIVFMDPSYKEVVSPTARRGSSSSFASGVPIALSAQAIATATSMGECRTFNFDRCFGVDNPAVIEAEPFANANAYDVDFTMQKPDQELVFEEVGRDMIASAFQGFNCTVLAYGQTGSGKTHTMVGEKTSTKGKGLIPRVCEALFEEIDARRASDSRVDSSESMNSSDDGEKESKLRTIFSAQISYCEIYKEKVNDLLDVAPATHSSTPKPRSSITLSTSGVGSSGEESMIVHSPTPRKALRVREHPVTGPFVEGLSSRSVTSYAEISEEMLAGDKLRTVAATLMNATSSRSHAVFTITFTQTSFDPATQSAHDKTSKICMIDLAGSERADVSGTSGDRLKEGSMINKSLSTLGRVISALSKQNSDRIPYRDSTLTWLLKESLGGNAKTTMIAMVSPAAENYEETMSTLRYAESAKKVINRAVVNEDENARIIRQLRHEIEELRSQLALVKRSPKRKVSSAGISASLSEREDFYQQLQKEVDFFRSQQQQQQLREVDTGTSSPHSDAVVRLHSVLPSLVNQNVGMIPGEDAVAYVLTEGTTIFGSQPRIPTQPAVVSDLDIMLSERPSPKSRNGRRSWSPALLKKRPSFLDRVASDTLTVDTSKDHKDHGELNDASPPEPVGRHDIPADCKLVETHASDVTPQHACFVCFKIEAVSNNAARKDDEGSIPSPHDVPVEAWSTQESSAESTQEPTAKVVSTAMAPTFAVEVQALDESAVLLVNGDMVPVGDRRKLKHGDEVALGHSIRLRLHVPGASFRASPFLEAISECDESYVERENDIDHDTNANHNERLKGYIEEANAICEKWCLATEFEICRIDNDSAEVQPASVRDSYNAVAIRKKLGDRRYSVENWDPIEFERQLWFLRDIAESLETSKASMNEDASNTTGVGEVKSEAIGQATDTFEMSVERVPDTPSSEAPAQPFTTTHPSEGNHLLPVSSLRLLGLGRIYLDGAHFNTVSRGETPKTCDDSPLPVAIHSLQGTTVGIIETYVTSEELPPPKERRGSQTLAWRSPKASFASGNGSSPTALSIRVRLGKLRLNDQHSTDTDAIWILLKQTTNDANNGVLAAKRVYRAAGTDGRQPLTFDATHTVSLPRNATVAVEIWCRHRPTFLLPLQVTDAMLTTRQLEVYFSVDIDERDSDGLYHPVPIKSDGTMRLTCGRPRRVNLHITQSDLLSFGLVRVLHASLSPPMRMRDLDIAGKDGQLDTTQTCKTIQHLVPLEQFVRDLLRLSNDGQLEATNAVTSKDGVKSTDVKTAWQSLDLRSDSITDPASRSIAAVVKWDHPSGQQQELLDPDGMRTVYRIVAVFSTCWSRNPVAISKTIVTKMSPVLSSTTKRLARDREATQTPWWARESSSRQFRVGTWYSVDISPDNGSDPEDGAPAEQEPGSTTATAPSGIPGVGQDMLVTSAVANYVLGLRRMELGVELERVRQQLWVALRGGRQPESSVVRSERESGDTYTELGLTVDLVSKQLEAINGTVRDASLHVECVEQENVGHGVSFFLRFKCWPSLVVGLIDGQLLSNYDECDESQGDSVREAEYVHNVYYAHTPTGLSMCEDVGSSSDMCGFLMLSVSHSPNDAATALVAPLPSRGDSSRRHSIASIAVSKEPLMSWQRQWFVLRRPFLYAYDSYERKVLTGVMNISACQIAAPSAKIPPQVASALGSSLYSSSNAGRSWTVVDQPSAITSKQPPFTFRLVDMTGGASSRGSKTKCMVWTLQASAAADLHAWLTAVQPPLNTETRKY